MIENLQEGRSYYVYRHLRGSKVQDEKTGTPFYIGKGTKTKKVHRRHTSEFERAYVISHRNEYWNRIVNKYGHEVEIIADNLTEQEAFDKEAEFIKIHGRVNNGTGILCNMTDGGEGLSGGIVSPETVQKILATKRARGYKVSAETAKKISLANMGRKTIHSEETKRKISQSNMGKRHSPESIERNRQTQLGRKQTKSQIEKARLAWIAKHSPQVVCLQTGFVFDGGSETARQMFPHKKLSTASDAVSKVCLGKIKSYLGYTFAYV